VGMSVFAEVKIWNVCDPISDWSTVPLLPVMMVGRIKVFNSVIVADLLTVKSEASATGTLSPAASVTTSASALILVSAIVQT